MNLDAELASAVERARAGDEQALATIFGALHPRLLRFLRAQEPYVAEDLAGEVWLAVAQGVRSFDGDAAALRAWVFSIARRRIADHRRRNLRRRTDTVPTSDLDARVAADDPAATAISAASAQEAAAVISAVLPPDQAEVVLLRVLADLDVDHVAEVLGRTPNWVRVTQHRAMRRLADRLGSKIGVIL